MTFPVAVPAAHLVTATATGPANNTSEFSAYLAVVSTLSDPGGATTTFTAPEVEADTALTFAVTVGDGMAQVTDQVNVTVQNVLVTEYQPARTIGYWSNHPDDVAAMLAAEPIDLGDTEVTTVDQVIGVLRNANADDARDSLRAQLLAAWTPLATAARTWMTHEEPELTA